MAPPVDDDLNRRDFLRLSGATVAAVAAGTAGPHAAADMNVYDAASLSAIVELSVRSNATRARAVDVPDFTRGRWRTNPKLGIVRV